MFHVFDLLLVLFLLPPQVGCAVHNVLSDSIHLWDFDTLVNRVSLMHGSYQDALRGTARPDTTAALADDPFYDPHPLQLCGRAAVNTRTLLQEPHSADITVPIYSDKVRVGCCCVLPCICISTFCSIPVCL